MDDLNSAFFLSINQYAGKSTLLDALAIFFAEAMPFILIFTMVCLWFFAPLDKKRVSFFAGYSVLLALLLSYLIGVMYFHPRPFAENIGRQLVEHAADTSFPSDHTTFIFAISFMYLFSKNTRVLGIWLSSFSLLAGLARVFVGVHYPFDILGAALLGAVSSLTIIYLAERLSHLERLFQCFRWVKLPNAWVKSKT